MYIFDKWGLKVWTVLNIVLLFLSINFKVSEVHAETKRNQTTEATSNLSNVNQKIDTKVANSTSSYSATTSKPKQSNVTSSNSKVLSQSSSKISSSSTAKGISGDSSQSNGKTAKNKTATQTTKVKRFSASDITPKHRPTGDPVILFGIWLTSGFSLQPVSDIYEPIYNTVSPLFVDTGLDWLSWLADGGLLASAKYTWYQSDDGGYSWTKFSTDAVPNITSNLPQDMSYQVKVVWTSFLNPFSTTLWSKVSTVHWIPTPKNPTSIRAYVDYPYLMNNLPDKQVDTTHAQVVASPASSTNKSIEWSSSNPDVATVDPLTGKVSAVNGATGTTTISCLWTNYDGSTLSASADVRVGGGLDDQTVHSGLSATFKLLGRITSDAGAESDTSIVWHRIAPDGKDTVVQTSDSGSYTLKSTTMNDNKAKYYAVITIKSGDKTKQVTTNKALLTVIPKPVDIQMDNHVFNITNPDKHNANNTELTGVQVGNHIQYKDTLKNLSTDTASDGDIIYETKINEGDKLNGITLDGLPLEKDEDYTLEDKGDYQLIKFTQGMSISADSSRTIKVDLQVGDEAKTQKQFDFYPSIQYSGQTNRGLIEHIKYASGTVSLKAKDIDFGVQNGLIAKKVYDRTASTNAPNATVDITDNRVEKDPISLTVTQTNPFQNEQGQNENNLLLRLYKQGEATTLIPGEAYNVADFKQGDTAKSVVWDKADGLRLYTDSANVSPGKYHSNLMWTIKNGY